jgi:putative oxidoreductase
MATQIAAPDWRKPYDLFAETAEKLFPMSLLLLVQRLGIAAVFFMSGRTKVDGLLTVNDTALELFRTDYALPLIKPEIAAYAATYSEHLFPILLTLGLFTRLSASALLIMTLVIEIFVYPEAWPTHGTWAACFLILMAQGPGKISLDHLIAQRYR